MRSAWLSCALLLAGCGSEGDPARLASAAAAAEASEEHCEHDPGALPEAPATPWEPAPGERMFGVAPDRTRSLTQLSAILDAPDQYRDQVVRTVGEIAQVCQRRGCWMELREEGAVEPRRAVRVPMAGHAFFLPLDVAGRRAMLEGRVVLEPLSAGARAHLESEGASATGSSLSIHASGVVVR